MDNILVEKVIGNANTVGEDLVENQHGAFGFIGDPAHI